MVLVEALVLLRMASFSFASVFGVSQPVLVGAGELVGLVGTGGLVDPPVIASLSQSQLSWHLAAP